MRCDARNLTITDSVYKSAYFLAPRARAWPTVESMIDI